MKEKTTDIQKPFILLIAFLFITLAGNFANAQVLRADLNEEHSHIQEKKKVLIPIREDNTYGVSSIEWKNYIQKTNLLLEKLDVESFLNYVVFSSDGNLADKKYFLEYVNEVFKKDKEALIYKVGKKQIFDAVGVSNYLSSLQPKYIGFYSDFKKTRDAFIEARTMRGPGTGTPTPFACGQPCTNPGFESGTGFWDYWSGTACASSSYDPCSLVAGFASSSHDLTAVADGFDATVGGTILPVVPPGGGNNAMMLGDGPVTGGRASRASISFTVSAANANFTYKYAVILQDPQTGHTDPERPYFKVKVRDAGGNVVACGDYEVMAKPPMTGFTETSSGSAIWYRNWTTVFIPLSSYIGQCVTIEFTVADCSQGGHYGYAYIDGDCDPLQIVSSSPAICGGSSITLTAPAGGVSYVWTNTAGGTTGIVGSTTGQTAVVNQAGTYNVQITMVSGPACIVNLQITVPSNPANPVASFTNTTVCAGTATQFTDTSTPVGSITAWSWDFNNDGVEDSNVQNPSFTFAGAGSYPVSLTITMGPCNATISQNITVNPGVGPAINPAGPFCSYTAPLNLTASVAGGTWSGTGVTSAANGTFDPSIATIGNNTITYTVTGACGGSATATVVVNAPPVSDAGADVVICSGDPASIGSTNVATNNYSWSPATGLSSASVSNPSITTTNSGSTPIVTTYTVTTTVAASGCQSTDDVTVTVNPLPVLVITNPAGVCSPNTVDITLPAITAGSTGGGTLTYWTNPAATNSLANPSTVGTSATYYIQSVSAGGCSDIEPVTVLINPLPVLAITNPAAVCAPNTVDITAAAVTAGSTGAGVLSYWQNATATTPLANPNAVAVSGTYYIQSTTPAGCTDIDPVVVAINQLPVLAITNPAAVCSPLTVDITVASITAGSTGSGTLSYWQDINATSSLANPSAISTSGTYYIQSSTAAGCTDIDPVVVTINETPVLTITNPGAVCAPNTVNITTGAVTLGSTGGGTLTYWQDAAGTIPLAAPNAVGTSGTYYIQSTTVSGCKDIDPVVVTINPLPVLSITNPAPGCAPNSVSITGASVTAGSTGNGVLSYWLDPFGTIPMPNPSAVNASGTYYIQSTTAAGCVDIDPVVVVINLSPNPAFFVDIPKGCPVHCVQFTDLSIIGGLDTIVAWNWNFGDGNIDNVQNPAHCYSQTGFYDVTLTVTSNNSCSSTLTIPQMIEVYPVPVAEFTHSPNPAFVTDPVITFTNQSSPDVIQWFWAFGDGYTLDPFTPNPTHTYPDEQAGAYMVTLSVQNANGCWASVEHPVAIGPEFTFYIPNAFTPNGDGVNDTFFGDGIGIIEYDIWIFDRWGNMIFHGDHLHDVWDGRANGGSDIAQQDVYVWKVKLKDVFEKKHSYIGSVTLVK